jgi:nucleotide-binding universal stress UspA family protein
MAPSVSPVDTAGFRDLVVYVDESAGARARLEFAARFARNQGAHLVALHALTEPTLPPSVRAFAGTSLMDSLRDQVREAAAEIRKTVSAVGAAEGIDIEYREAWGLATDVAILHARHADAAIVPQPDRRAAMDVGALAGNLVMESGRPVLIVPGAGDHSGKTEHVVCAWNGTRESARAVADALPLLRRAKKVSVLSIDPAGAQKRVPGADIALHLARHGVTAEATTTYADGIGVGDALLSRIADLGADMLVMGAYGHSRAREAVFGGATRDVLERMTVPVLMSH